MPLLLEKLERQMEAIGVGQIVSEVGRGIARDRDGNYAKTRRAFEAMVWGNAQVRARLDRASAAERPA